MTRSEDKAASSDDLAWLVSNLVDEVPGIEHAVVISSDGLVLTASHDFPQQHAEQLAAIISGLHSLSDGVSQRLAKGEIGELILRMNRGHLVVMSISDGSSLAGLTSAEADMKVVGHQMRRLVEGAAHVLTPQVRAQLVAPQFSRQR